MTKRGLPRISLLALLGVSCAFGPHAGGPRPGVGPDEGPFLSEIQQLSFAGRRTGEGYFSADGREIVFQSEREPGNPFYQIYRADLENGEIPRVSTGVGKTTCGWIHPFDGRVLFSSTHHDPSSEEQQREALVDPLSGVSRGDKATNGGAARFSRIVVDVSFEDRSRCPQLHDAVAVMFSDRCASQPAERAADVEDERSSGDSRELGSFLASPRSWSISIPREELTNEANLVHTAMR